MMAERVKIHSKDSCWTVLQYTQPWQNQTTPTLKGPNQEVAITMQVKKALIRAHAFSKPPTCPGRKSRPGQGLVHTWITREVVKKTLFC